MKFPKEMTRTLKDFEYFDPSAIDKAVSILRALGSRAVILAGGTDLLSQMKLRQIYPEFILNIKRIRELEHIRRNRGLEIGALTRIAAIRESEVITGRHASIHEAAEWFGTPPIRNMATVGGNLCRSSPSSDMIPPLMALNAMVRLTGPDGEREIRIEDFITGSGGNVLDREILTEIIVPDQEEYSGSAFRKLTRSSADLAKVSCAVKVVMRDRRCDEIRIVLGAVAEKVVRAKPAEEMFRGEIATGNVIDEVAKRAAREAQPITDVRSTADYRRQMSEVLVKRLIKLSIERAKGNRN